MAKNVSSYFSIRQQLQPYEGKNTYPRESINGTPFRGQRNDERRTQKRHKSWDFVPYVMYIIDALLRYQFV